MERNAVLLAGTKKKSRLYVGEVIAKAVMKVKGWLKKKETRTYYYLFYYLISLLYYYIFFIYLFIYLEYIYISDKSAINMCPWNIYIYMHKETKQKTGR